MKSFVRALGCSLVLALSSSPALADDDDDEDRDKEEEEKDADTDEDEGRDDADNADEDKGAEDKGGEDKKDEDKDEGAPAKSDGPINKNWGNDGNVPIEPRKDVISNEHRWDVHVFDFMTFGVGVVGNLGGTFLDKPDDQTVGGVDQVKPDYPGFAGLTSGVGPVIELRFIGYVGIELDILFQTDKGSAELEVTLNNQSGQFDVEIKQSAVHVPLLFKGAIPGRIVTPVLFLGPEFVIPDEASTEITGDKPAFHTVSYTAQLPDSYTAFLFGLGLEFNLPIPYVDVRIPFSLRGSFNPGVSDKRDERADHTPDSPSTNPSNLTEVSYSTEWKFEAMANFGVMVHF